MQSLLTLNEVATMLNVHRSTVAEMCRKGLITHRRIGVGRGVYRFKQTDVDLYLNPEVQPLHPQLPEPVESLLD